MDGFVPCLLLNGGVTAGFESGDVLPGRVEALQHGENPLLQGLLLAVKALHLEPHVLGLPGAHAAGKQPGLVLGQLGLEHLELALRFVELELESLQLTGRRLDLGR